MKLGCNSEIGKEYEDRRRDVAILWSVRNVLMVPIRANCLLEIYVEQLEMRHITSLLQKTWLHGAAKIIRRTLDS